MNVLQPNNQLAILQVGFTIDEFEIKKTISKLLNEGKDPHEIDREMVEHTLQTTLMDYGLNGIQNFEANSAVDRPEYKWNGDLVWDIFADYFNDFVKPVD